MDGVYGQATMIVEWVRKGRVWNEAVGMEEKKKKIRGGDGGISEIRNSIILIEIFEVFGKNRRTR